MTFVIGIFEFDCKSNCKQEKRNKRKWGMSKSDSIFLYLQNSILTFEILFLIRFLDKVYLKNE